jgi:hypothetical protein
MTAPHRNPDAEVPTGQEALAALSVLRGLRGWLDEIEPRLIGAARAGGVTWDALAPALGVGDRRAAHRRAARLAETRRPCLVPGLMETIKPGRNERYGRTEEVPGRAA